MTNPWTGHGKYTWRPKNSVECPKKKKTPMLKIPQGLI